MEDVIYLTFAQCGDVVAWETREQAEEYAIEHSLSWGGSCPVEVVSVEVILSTLFRGGQEVEE